MTEAAEFDTTGVDVPPPDEVTEGFWAATLDRRLVVQRCTHCGNRQHYPRPLCTGCGGMDLEYAPVTGDGTIDGFTVVHRAPRPGMAVPYVIARVRLAEGPVMLARLTGPDAASASCDRPVRLAWAALPDGRNLPVFRLAKD